MPDSVTLVLAERATGRPALVALAAAIEASAAGPQTDLALVRGAPAIAAEADRASRSGHAVVVAWSFFSSEAAEVQAELRQVRHVSRGPALHVAGGVHATAEPEATLALGFDLVARGEGEETIVGIASRLLAGGDPRTVAGLAWRGDGGLTTSGRAAPVDLDLHPASSRRLRKAFALEVTRGCVWACSYCQTPFLHLARFRHRSIASARAWARHGVELGHRDFRFLTPSALSYGALAAETRLEAVEALLAAVREEIGPERRMFFGTFPSELRPEHVSREALAIIRRYADNRELLIGAQSGSQSLLSAMRRGHDVEDVVRAVRLATAVGFDVAVDFVFGLPGETEEDRVASRRLVQDLARLGARIHAHAFMPLPGTPWRGEPAGRVDPVTRGLLERLASRGRAYGQWRQQVERGEELAATRRLRR